MRLLMKSFSPFFNNDFNWNTSTFDNFWNLHGNNVCFWLTLAWLIHIFLFCIPFYTKIKINGIIIINTSNWMTLNVNQTFNPYMQSQLDTSTANNFWQHYASFKQRLFIPPFEGKQWAQFVCLYVALNCFQQVFSYIMAFPGQFTS